MPTHESLSLRPQRGTRPLVRAASVAPRRSASLAVIGMVVAAVCTLSLHRCASVACNSRLMCCLPPSLLPAAPPPQLTESRLNSIISMDIDEEMAVHASVPLPEGHVSPPGEQQHEHDHHHHDVPDEPHPHEGSARDSITLPPAPKSRPASGKFHAGDLNAVRVCVVVDSDA